MGTEQVEDRRETTRERETWCTWQCDEFIFQGQLRIAGVCNYTIILQFKIRETNKDDLLTIFVHLQVSSFQLVIHIRTGGTGW